MTISTNHSRHDARHVHNLFVPHEPHTPSELSAMAFQGLLRAQFGPYYVAKNIPDTPAQRAKSVQLIGEQLIDGPWIAIHFTAAWIHLGGQAPENFEAATRKPQRSRRNRKIMPALLQHENYSQRNDITDENLVVIGGVVVTSIELTMHQMSACHHSLRHQHTAALLENLVTSSTP